MGETTEIAWTDHTFNPWWGCARVSPGCEHCYAESFAKRVGFGGKPPDQGPIRPPKPLLWGVRSDRRFFGDKHWAEPLMWNAQAHREGARRRVFCASMADVFEDRDDLVEPRLRLAGLISQTTMLDWQILTKRPENMSDFGCVMWPSGWPGNVWAGCTAEDQQRADERIPVLLRLPSRVLKFVSYEPALGLVDFAKYLKPTLVANDGERLQHPDPRVPSTGGTWEWGLDWIIVGGESGPGARPFDPAWARHVVNACRAARVACFVKQYGGNPREWVDADLGGIRSDRHGTPIKLRDRKGGDMSEWPEDLRVRVFPNVTT